MLFRINGLCEAIFIDESGKEVTYTEDQASPIINAQTQGDLSKYSLVCVEDCILVMSDVGTCFFTNGLSCLSCAENFR